MRVRLSRPKSLIPRPFDLGIPTAATLSKARRGPGRRAKRNTVRVRHSALQTVGFATVRSRNTHHASALRGATRTKRTGGTSAPSPRPVAAPRPRIPAPGRNRVGAQGGTASEFDTWRSRSLILRRFARGIPTAAALAGARRGRNAPAGQTPFAAPRPRIPAPGRNRAGEPGGTASDFDTRRSKSLIPRPFTFRIPTTAALAGARHGRNAPAGRTPFAHSAPPDPRTGAEPGRRAGRNSIRVRHSAFQVVDFATVCSRNTHYGGARRGATRTERTGGANALRRSAPPDPRTGAEPGRRAGRNSVRFRHSAFQVVDFATVCSRITHHASALRDPTQSRCAGGANAPSPLRAPGTPAPGRNRAGEPDGRASGFDIRRSRSLIPRPFVLGTPTAARSDASLTPRAARAPFAAPRPRVSAPGAEPGRRAERNSVPIQHLAFQVVDSATVHSRNTHHTSARRGSDAKRARRRRERPFAAPRPWTPASGRNQVGARGGTASDLDARRSRSLIPRPFTLEIPTTRALAGVPTRSGRAGGASAPSPLRAHGHPHRDGTRSACGAERRPTVTPGAPGR